MKTSVSQRAPRLVALLALALATLSVSNLSAQNATVVTTPVGYVGLTITAGSVAAPKYTAVNLPLIDGVLHRGTISAVTGNATVTVSSNVTETFSVLTSNPNPALLKLTSGSHAGRTFVINSNAGSTLTLNNDGTALDTLTPSLSVGASGDQFVIYGADTLNNYFGNRTFGNVTASSFTSARGNAQAAQADQVWVWNPTSSAYVKYYYYKNGDGTGNWRSAGFNTVSDNTILRPDQGILYLRRGATSLTLDTTGEVPLVGTKVRIRDSGSTYIGSAIPASTTLSGLGLQSRASWVSANQTTNPNAAAVAALDQVWVWNTTSSSFTKYYWNSSAVGAQALGWRAAGFNTAANPTLAVGTPVFIKKGATGQTSFTTVSLDLPANYAPLAITQ